MDRVWILASQVLHLCNQGSGHLSLALPYITTRRISLRVSLRVELGIDLRIDSGGGLGIDLRIELGIELRIKLGTKP